MAFLNRYFLFLISSSYTAVRMIRCHVVHSHFLTQAFLSLMLLGTQITVGMPSTSHGPGYLHNSTLQAYKQRSLPWWLPFHNSPPLVNIAPGIIFHSEVTQTPAGSEYISLLNVDLTAPNVHLGVVQAHDRLVSNDETVSSMANRTGAMAGVNGDYFEIGASGRPIGMVEMNGQLVQSPTVYAVLQETYAKRLTMGFESFAGSVTDGSASHGLASINHFAEAAHGVLVLATPALGAPIALPGDALALLQPADGSSNTFVVTSVQPHAALLPVLVGQNALLGGGEAGTWLTTHLHNGDHVSIAEHLAPNAQPLNAIGGGPILIMHGSLYNDPYPPAPGEANLRYPLTSISVSKDGAHVLFAVFDGRYSDPVGSPGLTHAEAAHYLLTHGAYQGMLFDSGGSSEMVTRFPGQHTVSVTNWPSDGRERPVANGLFVYSA